MMLVALFNGLISALSYVVSGLLELLPDSPFHWDVIQELKSYTWFQWVTYFIPFDGMLSVMMAYVTVVVSWYVVRWALRFIRYIG